LGAWICRFASLLLTLSALACHTAATTSAPPIVQPGAPGAEAKVIGADAAADLSAIRHTPADVRFMQGMIAHHAQALEMTALLRTRTSREEMRLLAQRIDISQADEIGMMQEWLRSRGEDVPAAHAHANHGGSAHGGGLMPGMLTPEELGRLAASTGAEFDRLFLEFMIKHHAGALTMVEELFAQAGAGQEPEIFAFASDVEADQRMEIERMGAMLKELQR
jgi:uncharacterized protein (DUF305 family)